MVPLVFSRFAMTIHIPRRPYTASLPGIPTIRPFEAMACGIPLISAPWDDAEHLFEPGKDFLMARNGREMQDHIRNLLADPAAAAELAARGRATIMKRHTCAHRVEELMAICAELGVRRTEAAAA
jgi:spore maturation protein CgeB